jgi:cytochrome P450
MPPCLAQNTVPVVDFVDPATESSSVAGNNDKLSSSMKKAKGNRGFFASQFHWELNFYTAAFFAFVYMILPEHYRGYMKLCLALIAVDAGRYYYMKGSMAGAPYTFPFVTAAAMLIRPERFWAEMADISMSSPDGLCTNLLVGKFVVFATDPKMCRQILSGEGTYQIYAHPNALWLFGEKNLIYMDTESHKDLRKVLTPALFSSDALEFYAKCQEDVIRRYMNRYVEECKETGKPIDLRVAFRSMAAAASQESFLGPYLDDEMRVKLEEDTVIFTMGFLSPPIPFVGGLKLAIEAKERIEKVVAAAVPKAKEYVLKGNEPRCLIERWAASIKETAEKKGIAYEKVFGCDDENIGRTVLDFLFAAQDATNSALTYAADVLAAHPDVVDKMTEEVESALGSDAKDVWTKLYDPDALSYTQKASNQLLHHKPPVPMIPHLSLKSSYFGRHYIPKGSLVIPSLFYSARESGSSVEFIPDRSDQDSQFVKCMTFGGGQHKCPGRKYAETQLTVFMALVAAKYRFERIGERPGQDDFIYFPTLFPIRTEFMVTARE